MKTFIFFVVLILSIVQISFSQSLRINEVMLGNSTSITDENGEQYPWIEIFNGSDDTINLSGYYLSDNPLNPYKWKFEEYLLKPYEYLIVFASERDLQAGPLSPTEINHLQCWFNSADVDTNNSAQVVKSNGQFFVKKWSSHNNAYNASQTTSAKQPNLVFNGIDGKPVIRFNGTSNILTSNLIPPTGNLPRTMLVMVANANMATANLASNNHILHYGSYVTGQAYGLTFQRQNLGAKIGSHYWSTTFYGIASMNQEKHFISSVYHDNTDNFYVDGSFAGQNFISLNTGNAYSMRIGSRIGSGAEYFGGDIAEVILYDTALSNSQRRRLENYFANKYGLSFQTFHTNFKLSTAGETILLTSPDSLPVHQFIVPELPQDHSYGYFSDSAVYFSQPTPWQANSSPGFSEILPPPFFSKASGFYTSGFNLAITSEDPLATILYTLDGSDPDTSALSGYGFPVKYNYPGCNQGALETRTSTTHIYSGPLQINPKYSVANDRSQIQAAYLLSIPPVLPINKATIIKAVAWKPNALKSKIVAGTYFVDSIATTRYQLPVVSLIIPDYDLFDYDTGIYVPGTHYDQTCTQTTPDANFKYEDWERRSHFELFDPQGNLLYRQYGGARIHGNNSTNWPRKSFRLEARNRYEDGNFEYPLFPGLRQYPQVGGNIIEQYNAFLIRNSGNNWSKNLFHDAMVHSLVSHLNVDGQASRAVVHFLNGEYWGIMNLREKHDEDYFAEHYNMNADDVIIANARTATVTAGYQYEYHHYVNLENYVGANSLIVPENYNYVNTQMDIENYLVHFLVEIYTNNTDFLGNNRKYWRKRTASYVPEAPFGQDGRWRWLLYDLDQTFSDPEFDRLTLTTTGTDLSTRILRKLLENPGFQTLFINTFCDQMNSSFVSSRVVSIIDSMKTAMNHDINEHIQRWNFILQPDQGVGELIGFANARPHYMRLHLKNRFSLGDTTVITLNTDKNQGKIKISTLTIDENTIGLANPAQPFPWNGVYFKGVPIEIEAIAKEGFVFSHWEGINSGNTAKLALTPTENLSLTAHFIPVPVPLPDLVHFWLFDNALPNDLPIETINATYSLLTGAQIEFHSALNGYPFTPSHPNWRKASMERRNAPTPVNYRPEGNNGLAYGTFTMRAIQVKQPFTGDGGENILYFHVPTTGYEDIVFRFAAKNEDAADALIVEYSVTLPPVWSSAELLSDTMPLTSNFLLYETDFTGITGVDENPNFKIRIRFTGSNMSADLGNRVTFNNMSIDGVSTYVPLDYYSKPTGILNALDTWGSQPDGSGLAPAGFGNDNTTFHVQNRTQTTLESTWTVSGIGSKVVVGDGAMPTNFTLNTYLNGLVDVTSNSTLTLAVSDYPTLGTLAQGSTVEFTSNAQAIPYRTYHHLKFSSINPVFTGNGTIIVQGNMTQEGTVNMPDARGSSLYSFYFSGSEAQVVATNGNVLRSYNMNFVKTAGSVNFTSGSIISTDNQLTLNFGPAATFEDNGITIYAGNSVNVGGTGSSYNFTGTLILAGTEAGIVKGSGTGNSFNVRDEDGPNKNIVAPLNNIIVRVQNTGGEFRFRDGSTNVFRIKGNFTVESGAAGRIRFYTNNNVYAGGNFIVNDGFAGSIDPIKLLTVNGIAPQTVHVPFPVSLTQLTIDNSAGVCNLDGILDVAQTLSFITGKINVSDGGMVKLGLTAQITGSGTGRYVAGSLGRRANNTTLLSLTYPVGTDNHYLPFVLDVAHSNTNEVVYVGKATDYVPLKTTEPETLEYILADYRYSIDRIGESTIASGKLTLPFDSTALGFDSQWLRVAKSTASGWLNLGGLVAGETIASTVNFIEPGVFALAKANETPVVPDTVVLQDVIVGDMADTCFSAARLIRIAGDGTTFAVENGGMATLVAGERIIFSPQATVAAGGYLYAYIDTTGTYCNSQPAMPSANEHDVPGEMASMVQHGQNNAFFRLYPNPTSGRFTIEVDNGAGSGKTSVEIRGMIGQLLVKSDFQGNGKYSFDLTPFPAGIYLLRVLHGDKTGYAKVIKR